MITLTWAKINDRAFGSAIMRLNQERTLDQKTAYRVGRLYQTAISAMKKAQTKELEINKKYFKEGTEEWLDDAAAMQARAEYDKLMEETKEEVKIEPLDFSELKGLTGVELVAIEEICTNIPDVA